MAVTTTDETGTKLWVMRDGRWTRVARTLEEIAVGPLGEIIRTNADGVLGNAMLALDDLIRRGQLRIDFWHCPDHPEAHVIWWTNGDGEERPGCSAELPDGSLCRCRGAFR